MRNRSLKIDDVVVTGYSREKKSRFNWCSYSSRTETSTGANHEFWKCNASFARRVAGLTI
jgi:hypothetical protein